MSLEVDTVYALLESRADGTWHWAFFVPDRNTKPVGKIGRKIHAVNRTGAWVYESVSHDVLNSPALSLASRIGRLSQHFRIEKMDETLRRLPMEPAAFDEGKNFSCRIWFRAAVAELQQHGVLSCPDIDLLEEELKASAAESDPIVWAGGPATYTVSMKSTVS